MDVIPDGAIIDAQLTPAASAVVHVFGVLDSQTADDAGTDYKKLYYFIFNGVTDILKSDTITEAVEQLKLLQIKAEEMFIGDD